MNKSTKISLIIMLIALIMLCYTVSLFAQDTIIYSMGDTLEVTHFDEVSQVVTQDCKEFTVWRAEEYYLGIGNDGYPYQYYTLPGVAKLNGTGRTKTREHYIMYSPANVTMLSMVEHYSSIMNITFCNVELNARLHYSTNSAQPMIIWDSANSDEMSVAKTFDTLEEAVETFNNLK